MFGSGKRTGWDHQISVLAEIIRNAKLTWRLLRDDRVSPWLKAVLPALIAAYVLLPIDLFPDILPLAGQLDDLAITLLGVKLFIQLCPPDVVRQHLQELSLSQRPSWRKESQTDRSASDNSALYIEVPYHITDKEEP